MISVLLVQSIANCYESDTHDMHVNDSTLEIFSRPTQYIIHVYILLHVHTFMPLFVCNVHVYRKLSERDWLLAGAATVEEVVVVKKRREEPSRMVKVMIKGKGSVDASSGMADEAHVLEQGPTVYTATLNSTDLASDTNSYYVRSYTEAVVVYCCNGLYVTSYIIAVGVRGRVVYARAYVRALSLCL